MFFFKLGNLIQVLLKHRKDIFVAPAKPSDGLPGALCTAAHGSEGIGCTTSTTGHSCHHQDKRHLFMAFCTRGLPPGQPVETILHPGCPKELAPPGVERSFLCPNYTWFSCLTGSLGSFLGGFFFLFPCEISRRISA